MPRMPERLTLHVRDKCEGIPPETLQTVFEPFRRAHPGKPSPGLGLALARQIVEAQGGGIAADSEGPDGCRFRITLRKALS